MHTQESKMIYGIVERHGRCWWRALGEGSEGADGSIHLRLDELPKHGAEGARRGRRAAGDREGGVMSHLRALAARVRAAAISSAWTGIVARAGLLAIALSILAWIGRATATTREPAAPALDGGLAPAIASAGSSAHLPPPAPVTPPPVTAQIALSEHGARATSDDPVYVNYASADELRRLPGVGPKRAVAILALRQRLGRFQRVEDLLRVKGIGRATIRKWRPLVRLDAPPVATADAGRP